MMTRATMLGHVNLLNQNSNQANSGIQEGDKKWKKYS